MQQRAVNRSNRSMNYTLPAPIGGINARDSLSAMSELDAIAMDNYIPLENKVALRKGFVEYVGLSAPVETLAEFRGSRNNSRLFAFTQGSIFDITSKTEVVDYKKGFASDYWQWAQFKDRLIAVNGVDAPQAYYANESGEHWEDVQISGEGLNPKLLINVEVSKQRLFFVEKNSLKCWYSSGVGEVQGTLKAFDFSALVTKGGCLQAVASWTQDGGQGIDDLTVFITSEGEALVYAGNDPGNADDWALKGKYTMSKPIGYKCVLQYQGDIVMICEDGYIPLSKALPLDKANSSQISFSDKIRGLLLSRTKSGKNKQGWQGIIYGRGGYAIFNVPVAQQFEQHVINVNTGAWCRFVGIAAKCWGMLNDRLYFGTVDGVYLFDEGYSDNKVHILGKIKQAYSNLGTSSLKKVQMINPRNKSSTKYALTVYTNTDYADVEKTYTQNLGFYGLSRWNEVTWSKIGEPSGLIWASLQGEIRSRWLCNSATGFKISLVLKTKTRGNFIEFYETGFRYEQGEGIV